jgi:hypothetical protein
MFIEFHIRVQSFATFDSIDEPTNAPMDVELGDCVAAR